MTYILKQLKLVLSVFTLLRFIRYISFCSLSPIYRLFFGAIAASLISFSQHSIAEDWIYTVRKSDTLWDLCKTYTHVPNCWLKIGEYNKVTFPKIMSPGTRIRFPASWLKHPPTSVKLTYLKGDVFVIRESSDKEASATDGETRAELSDELFVGDSIRTGEQSSVTLLFGEGSVLVVEENSYLVMDLLSLSGNTTIVDTRVNLLRGSVRAIVPKEHSQSLGSSIPEDQKKSSKTRVKTPSNKPKLKRRFEIETPSAVAAVRGTEFRVSAADEGKRISGEVYSGVIAMSKSQKKSARTKELKKKFGLVVEKEKPIGDPVELLDAPNYTQSETTYFSPINIAWEKLLKAKSYVVSLFPKTKPNNLLIKENTINSSINFPELKIGCYTLVAQGVDHLGLQGLEAKKSFCVEERKLLPAPKISITHDKVYNGSVLMWAENSDASEYLIEFSNNQDFSKISKSIPAYDGEYTISIIEKRTFKFVRVKSVADDIAGYPSKILSTNQ